MAERLLRPGARVIADNVLHPGAPLFVNDVKERYDLEVRPRVVLIGECCIYRGRTKAL